MSSRDYQSSNNRENQLFIGRLPRNVSEKTVEDKFGQYGKMVRCDVKQGQSTLPLYCNRVLPAV